MAGPAPRLALPRFLEQARAETIELPLERAGVRVAPSGGTFTLLDATGGTVETGAVVVDAHGVATFAVPGDFADGYTLPQHAWRERWALEDLPGAPGVLTIEHQVLLCRRAPTRHATVEDLYRLHSEWRRLLPQARQDVDEPIEVAWEVLVRRLLSDGHLPGRVLDWWRLSHVHTLLAAAIVCRDFQTDARGDSRWERLGTEYEARAWADYGAYLGLAKDEDEDGVEDNPGVLQAAHRPLWLG